MDIENLTRDKSIRFYLRRDEEKLMENLSFIHLVMMKFDSENEVCESFQKEGNDEYIKIVLSFPDWSAASNAIAHCNQNLDQDGNVKNSYKGALPKADPSGAMAERLLKKALANRT